MNVHVKILVAGSSMARVLPRPASCTGMINVEFEMRNQFAYSVQFRNPPSKRLIENR
jgi:hypothetical protein